MLRSDDERLLLPVITHDIDPEALALVRAIFAARPIPTDSQHPVADVFRSGSPLLIPRIDPEPLRARLQPEYWAAIDRLRVSSAVIAPLQVEGRSIGVLGLTRRQQLRPAFIEQDLKLAQNLADRAAIAIAIAIARLYQQFQEERALLARRVAERTADLSLANADAVKFTPEGGRVGLEVRGSPEEQTVTFTVWDTGIGIATEDLRRLFQPFVQLDSSLGREHTGTGLGLALVARLTRAHGGSVRVESKPGEGSRFHITLPWGPAAAPVGAAPATMALPSTRPAIGQAMVIEDSPTAAEQLTRYLTELGARVEVLPYGAGVTERAIALQPDVILLDILLPDDSWQVLRQLKADPRTRAIPARATALRSVGGVEGFALHNHPLLGP